MGRFWIQVWIVAAIVVAVGCRQPDGAVPEPAGEQPNKLSDIARNLQNMTASQAGADGELLDDLDNLDSRNRPRPLVQSLAQSMGAALSGKSLSEPQAQQLARHLFVVVTGSELSERQIDQASSALRQSLVDVRADPAAADRVAAAASALGSEITRNRDRWYYWF
jgi:hypothetical protein